METLHGLNKLSKGEKFWLSNMRLSLKPERKCTVLWYRYNGRANSLYSAIY